MHILGHELTKDQLRRMKYNRLSYQVVYGRMAKGETLNQALSYPRHTKRRRHKAPGTPTAPERVAELTERELATARKNGLGFYELCQRFTAGWSRLEAVHVPWGKKRNSSEMRYQLDQLRAKIEEDEIHGMD